MRRPCAIHMKKYILAVQWDEKLFLYALPETYLRVEDMFSIGLVNRGSLKWSIRTNHIHPKTDFILVN